MTTAVFHQRNLRRTRILTPLLLGVLITLPSLVFAGGNADCIAGDYSCDYPTKKQVNTNGAIQTIQCLRNKPCNMSVNGAIVESKCVAANDCAAKQYKDVNNQTKEVKDTGDADSKAAADKIIDDISNEMNAAQAGDPQAALSDPGLDQALDNSFKEVMGKEYAPDPNRDADIKNAGFDLEKELGLLDWSQYASDDYINKNFNSGRMIDLGFDQGSGFGFKSDLIFVSNAEFSTGAWGGSPSAGVGSYTGYSGFGGQGVSYQFDGGNTTGFGGMPTQAIGGRVGASPFIGNTSAVVWGSGASPDLSASGLMMAQSQAQLQAQANSDTPGAISNYLQGSDAWKGKSFGEWVSEGVQNAGEQIRNAWDGAVAGVQDAFAPSVVDTSSVNGINDATGVSGSSDGSSVGNSSNDTLQGADGYQLPEVVVDTSAKPADWAGEQGRDSIGHDITDDLSSPDDVAPAKDGFSFDQAAIDRGKSYYTTDADLTNPKNLASPFIGMKSPVDFEIRPGDASPLPPEVSQMHETAFQGFEQTYTGTAFPNPSTGQSGIMNRANPDAGTTGGTVPPPINTTGVGRESVSTGRTSGGGNFAPAPSPGSGGGGEGIGQLLSSLLGMLKGGGGGGSGGGNSQPKLPPVTAASNSVLQTPVPSTQFAPAPPLTAAPTVSVVANPDDIASGAQSVIAWSAVWADAQATSTTRKCAVIDATGKTLVQSASTTSSYETGTLTRSAYYVVGCKQSGGKLGSGVVLVKVKGDTQGPIPFPTNLGTYQSVTGSSNPAAELSNAIRPAGAAQQPQQVVEVACDPNSQNYIDCLTGKMQFVDKLYE